MYKDIFIQAGLSPNEAIVYDFLLKNGENPAGQIIKKTPLKRGVVYNALADLVKKELIYSKKKNKIAHFGPNHPEKLREYAQQREKEIQKAGLSLDANMQNLTSVFKLVSGQPGIRNFEGLSGIKKVLEDTLVNNPQKEILTFSDLDQYSKYLVKWNEKHYAPKRKELEIKERAIVPLTPKAEEFLKQYMKDPLAQNLTEIVFIKKEFLTPFATETNIYGNKVSFVTFSEKGHLGIIIENPQIVATLKSIFNFTWKIGKKYQQSLL